MAIGGNLTVTNTSARENFTVSVSRNLEITNFEGRKMGEPGDIHTKVRNGSSSTDRISQDGDKINNRATLDLRNKRYAIFDKLRSLDGNANDLSEQDLAKADSLKGTLGITNITRNAKAGITTITCNDGAVLRFDFETKEEQSVRERNEAKKKAAAKAKQDQEHAQLKQDTKSTIEKLWEGFLGWFD